MIFGKASLFFLEINSEDFWDGSLTGELTFVNDVLGFVAVLHASAIKEAESSSDESKIDEQARVSLFTHYSAH